VAEFSWDIRSPLDRALVTGFVPYGGRGRNPAAEIATALDGRTILGMPVIGRTLPVSYSEIRRSVEELLDELRPRIVISLGLWPGATTIRVERVGVNVADFEIPDNTGRLANDELIVGNGSAAMFATLPIRKIEQSGHHSSRRCPRRAEHRDPLEPCPAALVRVRRRRWRRTSV